MALMSRSLCGLLNGNIGVAKCVLGEITDDSNQSFAFSLFGFLYGMGTLVAPMLGGLLSNPATKYPNLFGNWGLFIEFPYLLPCIISSLVSLFGFVVGLLFFEETLHKSQASEDHDNTPISDQKDVDLHFEDEDEEFTETKPLLFRTSVSGREYRNNDIASDQESENEMRASISALSVSTASSVLAMPASVGSNHGFWKFIRGPISAKSVRKYSETSVSSEQHSQDALNDESQVINHGATSDANLDIDNLDPDLHIGRELIDIEEEDLNDGHPSKSKIQSASSSQTNFEHNGNGENNAQKPPSVFRAAASTIAGYGFVAFIQVLFQEVSVLWCQTEVKYGGLGWSSGDVGISMAISGILLLTIQLSVYPAVSKRFGYLTLYKWALIGHIPMFFSTAWMNNARDAATELYGAHYGSIVLWFLMSAHHLVRSFCQTFAFTSIMVMINNSATLETLGVINGAGQMCASGVRAIGPALGGIMWQFSLKSGLPYPGNYHLVFVLLSIVSFIGWLESQLIPKECESAQFGRSQRKHPNNEQLHIES